jgi:hypothetical protein
VIDIPYAELGIPLAFDRKLDDDAPREARLQWAAGKIEGPRAAVLAVLYALACSEDDEVHDLAVSTVRALPAPHEGLHQGSHPKVLEMLAQIRPDPVLDRAIIGIRSCNDRTVAMIAARADHALAANLCADHERLMVSPDVLVALYQNPATPDDSIESAKAYLRMQGCLPALPEARGGEMPARAAAFDLEAEIEAALSGKASPMLEARKALELFDYDTMKEQAGSLDGFSFDFRNDDEFSLDLLEEGGAAATDEARENIAKRIAKMSPGKKIKLAYLGNKEARAVLIRDRNKQVAVAVVKSGRLSDPEVSLYAGNRNLDAEVLREIASNKQWTKKYVVKVALVNNPRVPPSIGMGMIQHLFGKDLEALARNKNVASVITTTAARMLAAKQANKKG